MFHRFQAIVSEYLFVGNFSVFVLFIPPPPPGVLVADKANTQYHHRDGVAIDRCQNNKYLPAMSIPHCGDTRLDTSLVFPASVQIPVSTCVPPSAGRFLPRRLSAILQPLPAYIAMPQQPYCPSFLHLLQCSSCERYRL